MQESRTQILSRPTRNAALISMVEPELRALVQREAEKRDISISSTIRALIKAQLVVSPRKRVEAV